MEYIKIYDEILKAASDFSDDVSDKTVICDSITNNIIYLLKESTKFIEEGKATFAFPILRQAYEFIILNIAFVSGTYSINQFVFNNYVENKGAIKDLYNKVLQESGKTEAERTKAYDKAIKDILNKHTHANFTRLLYYLFETNSNNNMIRYMVKDAKRLLYLVNAYFFSFVKTYYKMDYIKEIKENIEETASDCNLNYEDIILKDKILDRILKIPSIKEKCDIESDKFREEFAELRGINKNG